MKTLEEFIKEIESSEELKEELKSAYEEALGAFLQKHGCEATAKEFSDFVRSQEEGEICDGDVETVAGGMWGGPPTPQRTPIKPQGIV